MYTLRCHVHKICPPLGDALSRREDELLTRRINQPVGMKAKMLAPTSTTARSNPTNKRTNKPMRTRKTMPLRTRNTS
jgi:hypothetical protein